MSSIIGPSLAALMVDLTGSYNDAYYLAAGLLVFSMIIIRFLKEPENVLETLSSLYEKCTLDYTSQ